MQMNETPRPPVPAFAALALLLLMAVVVAASGWLRLTQPRVACESWPQCRFVQAAAAAPAALPRHAEAAVRGAHRAAASAALLLIVGLLVLAWRRRDRPALPLLAALLGLALGLSLLGIVTPGSRAAAVMLGNLLGGALMFALAWVLWRTQRDAPPMPLPLRRAALGMALAWLAQAALGALSGADAGWIATLLHLLGAVLLPIAGFVLALAVRRAGRPREARALLGLLALQVLLGLAGAIAAAPAAAVLVHNAAAALGLALLLGWAMIGGGETAV
jgi:heme A synthase